MIQHAPVAVWFLFSSHLSVCLSSAPPLSTINEINIRRLREQVINIGENVDERGKLLDQDTGRAVDDVPLSKLYNSKWKNKDGVDDSDLLKRGHFVPSPHLQLSTMHEIGEKVDIKGNATISRTTNTTASTADTKTTTTMPDSLVPNSFYPSSSSSCSSLACKWLASSYFLAVTCVTVTWLVVLMILYCMTRTARGRLFLETWSSMCIPEKKDREQNQVLAKGIGYFDGSPGLRRFVLIEDDYDDDDDDEEEEEEKEEKEEKEDNLFASEFKDVNKADEETERETRISKKWKPPRKGTYILQEASMKDVFEIGTYRLQEGEEEVEVNGKRKDDNPEGEVEYILEGATYILQSERVQREGIGEYGQTGGIEGLYGVVGRGGLQRGYGRIDRLGGAYGITGRGVAGDRRYGGVGGIDGLDRILKEEESGGYGKVVGEGKRGEVDGVLLSVRELEGDVGGEEKVREESIGKERGEDEEWREAEGKDGDISVHQREGSRERKVEHTADGERKERGKIRDTWGGRRQGGGARFKLGRIGEERVWGLSPPPKRAASFPMDQFLSSHLMPRKLSLIVEE